MAKYLNLGCGNRTVQSTEWLNADFTAHTPGILAVDLRKKLPFDDDQFDLVYHCHVLEHLTCSDAENFLAECRRILKPGGIIRVVVPDLENIIREYIHLLEQIRAGITEAEFQYDWIMLELYDQAVRQIPGGMMLKYLQQLEIPGRDYVLQRGGKEVGDIIARHQIAYAGKRSPSKKFNSPWHRLRYYLFWKPKQWLRSLPTNVKYFVPMIREKLISLLLGQEYNLLKIIRFRHSGEIHQWMYDAYSLGKLLQKVGFTAIQVQNPERSFLNCWREFNLDTEPDGSIYKPHSLYMEAQKPLANS